VGVSAVNVGTILVVALRVISWYVGSMDNCMDNRVCTSAESIAPVQLLDRMSPIATCSMAVLFGVPEAQSEKGRFLDEEPI
jgi:hypothetical protein